MKLSRAFLSLVLAAAACSVSYSTGTKPAQTPGTDAKPATPPESGEVAQSPALPIDPAVRVGKLDNGLTYYIRNHNKPEQRAAMWLAVDAGAVLEDEDQQGLAHFVEHMAFNGTKRFAKNTLIDYIEKAGMDFGADLNAFTSFDETVYQLTVPTDDPKTVATGFDILEDWASEISFDKTEVDKERGVVIEEWRLGRGASQRVRDQQFPIFLKDSKYAERLPIGKKEILETAPVDTLKRFYRDWYRPDLMAVIVVGDLDPDQVEKEIKARFSKLKNPENERPRENIPVPILKKTRAAIVTDKEASMTQVQVAIKQPARPYATEADFRTELIEDLFHGMLRARLDEIRQQSASPYMFAFSFTSTMGRSAEIFQLFAGAKTGQSEEALRTLLTELERVHQHGFLATEFERQKADALREYENAESEDAKMEGRRHAFRIVNAFLEQRAMPAASKKLELAKEMIGGIKLAEVNALAEQWTASKDRVVMASGPARDEMPGKKKLLAVVDQVEKAKIGPYVEEASSGALLAVKPPPGKVVSEKTIASIGVTEWTLSNGARVVVKPTDFKNDEIRMQAFSPGGTSLVKDKNFASGRFASAVASAGGVGDHDRVALTKMLQGKDVNVFPFVSEFEEGLRGSGSPKDLETLMQLVYLNFTAPRRDEDAFDAFKSSQREFVKNRDLNPQRVFFDQFQSELASNNVRRLPLTLEEIDKIELDKSLDIYANRFADAGDFTFVFVGNVDMDALKTYSEQYLASLPSTQRKENWKDLGVRPPKGIKTFRVEQGQDPKSFVMMNFHGPQKWSPEAEDDIKMLADVMDIRLREVLREDMSGVYGAFSRGSVDRRPRQEYGYMIGFGCAPENVSELKAAVFGIISEIKKDGVKPENIDKVKEIRRRKLETDLKENRYWLSQLTEHYQYGTDASKIGNLEEATARVSSANVQKAAKKYLNTRRYLDGVLMPAGSSKVEAKVASETDKTKTGKTKTGTKAKTDTKTKTDAKTVKTKAD